MSDFTVVNMRVRGAKGKVKAWFTLSTGQYEISDMRLIVGANGPFVGFPSKEYTKKDGDKDWIDIVKLVRVDGKLTQESYDLSNAITEAAVAEYERRTHEKIDMPEGEADDSDLPF
ncbi:MAG: hypothetical protein KOO63_03045 [Bacteroidales bacterium]|nr:hypothetical protein [Candidatus Latescibacterota bacterium]